MAQRGHLPPQAQLLLSWIEPRSSWLDVGEFLETGERRWLNSKSFLADVVVKAMTRILFST